LVLSDSGRCQREYGRSNWPRGTADGTSFRSLRPLHPDAKNRSRLAAFAANGKPDKGRTFWSGNGSFHWKRRCRIPMAILLTGAGLAESGSRAKSRGWYLPAESSDVYSCWANIARCMAIGSMLITIFLTSPPQHWSSPCERPFPISIRVLGADAELPDGSHMSAWSMWILCPRWRSKTKAAWIWSEYANPFHDAGPNFLSRPDARAATHVCGGRFPVDTGAHLAGQITAPRNVDGNVAVTLVVWLMICLCSGDGAWRRGISPHTLSILICAGIWSIGLWSSPKLRRKAGSYPVTLPCFGELISRLTSAGSNSKQVYTKRVRVWVVVFAWKFPVGNRIEFAPGFENWPDEACSYLKVPRGELWRVNGSVKDEAFAAVPESSYLWLRQIAKFSFFCVVTQCLTFC